MADTLTCPICDTSIQRQIIEAEGCEFCGATLPLIKIMNDILDEHYDELEAAGLNIHTRIDPPPVIPYLRSLWLEKEDLSKLVRVMATAMQNIEANITAVKAHIK
jgi:hypothetical protein